MRLRKFINKIKIIYSAKAKRIRGGLPPAEIWIEPTNFCNLRCKMCPQSGGLTREKGFMNLELYKKIIDEVGKWKPIIKLFNLGEPLLHPEIVNMIKYAKKKGCYVMINTNATLLNEKKSIDIINSGLDEISFSFDGVNKKVYEDIRKNANFNETLHNIITFLKLKKGMKKKKPFTVLAIIKMEDTEKEIENFFKKFKDLPVNKKRIQPLMDWAGQKKVDGTVRRGKIYSVCKAPWTYLSILWDGRVVPCCMDFNALYVLGNVKEEKIFDIINSKKMIFLKKALLNKDIEKIALCKNCHVPWPSKKE